VKKGLNNFSGRGTAYVLLGYDIMHWLKIISDMRLNEDGMSRGMLIIPGEIGTN
jgi:hypothetical protein